MDFDSLEDFIKYEKSMIERSAKISMDKLKEKAKQIVEDKIYGAFEPTVYDRMGLLTENFELEYEWQGDTYICTLKVSGEEHPYNSTWNGKAYPFDEIINYYFAEGHGWGKGSNRPAVDALKLTQEEMIETGKAMKILLEELKKYFDIE